MPLKKPEHPFPWRAPLCVAVAVLLTTAAAALPRPAAGEPVEVVCDPGLEAADSRATAYQHRGDRCEGVYALKVSSDKLRLVSFTTAFGDFDPRRERGLEIEWPLSAPAGDAVRLRAYSLNPRTYYRMDSAAAPASGHFTWNSGLLEALGLRRPDLGVVGWTFTESCGDGPLYLPLSIHPPAEAVPAAPAAAADVSGPAYEVVIVPGEKLAEVFLTIRPVEIRAGSTGEPPEPSLPHGEPLGYGFYPAREPTVLSLEPPSKPGIYRLTLGADFQRGGSTSTTFCFFHPGV